MSEYDRDDNFYSLGYTTPEDAEHIKAAKTAPHRTASISPLRRAGNVRDFESDRDHEPHTDTGPMTPEEQQATANNIAATQKVVDTIEYKNALARAGGDEHLAALFLQAAMDRRLRTRAPKSA